MTDILIKRRNLDTETDMHRGKMTRLQATERVLEQILSSKPSEGTNPADTLNLDFQPPACGQ